MALRSRLWGCIALALLLTSLAPPATADTREIGPGPVYLPGALVVDPDVTLRLLPGTRLHGPGHLEVRGALEVLGNATHPVDVQVPIALYGNGTTRIERAHIHNISGAALTQRAGDLHVLNTSFDDNLVGLLVVSGGDARTTLQNTTFTHHRSAGARIYGAADTLVIATTFHNNTVGLDADLDAPWPTGVAIESSRFEDNHEHLRVDFGDTTGPVAIARIADSTFARGTLHTESAAAAGTPGNPAHALLLYGNTLRDADIALHARGGGYTIESRNDTLTGNRIGILAIGADIRLEGTRFDSTERDLDLTEGTALHENGVRFTALDAPRPRAAAWAAPVLGALLLAAATGAAIRRFRRAPANAAPPPAPTPPEPSEEQAPAPAAPAPAFTDIELRILNDIAAHPGTAQAAIAERLGLSRQALHYHVKRLSAAGHVHKTPKGRTTECRLAPDLALPPLPPRVNNA